MAAFAAQAFLQHDVRFGMSEPLSDLAGVQDFLSLVRPRVTGPAVGQGFDVPDDLVLDLEVALVAFDFVQGDVVQVDEVRVAVLFEALPFEVALVAVFSGHGAVADDRPAVAFIATEAFGEDDGVVEARYTGRSEFVPVMTMGTLADRRVGFTLFEVTDKTGALGDRDVFSLDDLGVAACAAKSLTPLQVGQMNFMVKNDFLKLDLALEQPFLVTSLAEAALVGDFGPGLGLDVKFGPVTPQLHQAFDLGPEK